jgi:hypothetical protein
MIINRGILIVVDPRCHHAICHATNDAPSRLHKVTSSGKLRDAMDEEDNEFGTTIKVELVKSGNLSSDSDDDPEKCPKMKMMPTTSLSMM